jgi:hypothetical protein
MLATLLYSRNNCILRKVEAEHGINLKVLNQ